MEKHEAIIKALDDRILSLEVDMRTLNASIEVRQFAAVRLGELRGFREEIDRVLESKPEDKTN